MRRLVTCPETGHLEELEYESSPFGMLILACTRFRPACAIECPGTCAARFDRRERPADREAGEDTNVHVYRACLVRRASRKR